MNEKEAKKTLSDDDHLSPEEDVSENRAEFTPLEFKINPLSSAQTAAKNAISVGGEIAGDFFPPEKDSSPTAAKDASAGEKEAAAKLENPVFSELAEPKLPRLKRENRSRLQMQTPTRLHFYWTLKDNPFETLRRVFGSRAENYTLVVKLVNQTTGREEIYPVQIEGSHWFNVDADSAYQTEIGFHAAHRPFVRLMFSNLVKTPRRNPSARRAADADWTVSADSFAQVLDNSGFAQDALEVALAGDDREAAETATQAAFEHFFGGAEKDFAADNSSEMRFALLALASGYSMENLREQISPTLFAKLRENAGNLNAEKAIAALRENFNLSIDENTKVESPAPTVFGASLINFPRLSKRRFLPKFAPVSSLRVAESFR